MSVFLQIVGGLFYLLQKVFLVIAERKGVQGLPEKPWRVWAWSVYLVGLPAWAILFVLNDNWIAAALEVSGGPGMLLGLTLALQHKDAPKGAVQEWLDRIALIAIGMGFGYSLREFGGITTVHQWLELGTVLGFLFGNYQLAHKKPTGYLWYFFMCSSNAALMWVDGYPWLVAQQIVSLGFIVDGFRSSRKRAALLTV